MPVALSLDLGTTSISAVAVDETGCIVAKVHVPNHAAVTGLPQGCAEQDPLALRVAAVEALRQLATNLPGTPHCLGLTGQMHSVLLVDKKRQPLGNLITWQDRRANEMLPGQDRSCLDEYLDGCDELALLRSGCRLSPGYMAVTLFVLTQQNELPEKVERASFLADWIGAELCDVPIVTDRSNAASSGVYDLERDCWSDELIEAGNLSAKWFPSVRESGEVIGKLTPEFAAETGLPAGLPVCNAIGDNQAAVLGSVPVGDPAIQINVGTGGQINWPVKSFQRLPDMDTRYLPHHRYMLVGAGLAGGDAYAWVNRTMVGLLESLGLEANSEAIYERMNELAAAISAENDGLLCEPLFRGTRRQPNARGSFAGVTFDNFTLGHVSRSVLQGIAAGFHWFYENAGNAKPIGLKRIIGSGNGLRKNRLLVEILSRTFDREVWLPVHQEEAAYGAALLAGSMTDLWPDLETAGRQIRLEQIL